MAFFYSCVFCSFQEVPLQSVPLATQPETLQAMNFGSSPSKIADTHQITSTWDETTNKYQGISQVMEVDNLYQFQRDQLNYGSSSASFMRQSQGFQTTASLYDDIALPDGVLNDYYSQVLPGTSSLATRLHMCRV